MQLALHLGGDLGEVGRAARERGLLVGKFVVRQPLGLLHRRIRLHQLGGGRIEITAGHLVGKLIGSFGRRGVTGCSGSSEDIIYSPRFLVTTSAARSLTFSLAWLM